MVLMFQVCFGVDYEVLLITQMLLHTQLWRRPFTIQAALLGLHLCPILATQPVWPDIYLSPNPSTIHIILCKSAIYTTTLLINNVIIYILLSPNPSAIPIILFKSTIYSTTLLSNNVIIHILPSPNKSIWSCYPMKQIKQEVSSPQWKIMKRVTLKPHEGVYCPRSPQQNQEIKTLKKQVIPSPH